MKGKRGFTLIEIVIVVAIIGLLMVTLVPSITSSWKTNNMKAARLQAERVAKSVRVGIFAKDVKTSGSSKAYDEDDGEKVPINPTLNCVKDIIGIETLFDDPENNEDLVDTTDDNQGLFKIAYDSSNDKIIIFRAKADVTKTIDENNSWQLYYEQ